MQGTGSRLAQAALPRRRCNGTAIGRRRQRARMRDQCFKGQGLRVHQTARRLRLHGRATPRFAALKGPHYPAPAWLCAANQGVVGTEHKRELIKGNTQAFKM